MKKAFLGVIASASILLLGSSLVHAVEWLTPPHSPPVPVFPVPEPCTMLLVGTGVAGLAVYRGIKNRKK